MSSESNKGIKRRNFIKKSSAGLFGASLLGAGESSGFVEDDTKGKPVEISEELEERMLQLQIKMEEKLEPLFCDTELWKEFSEICELSGKKGLNLLSWSEELKPRVCRLNVRMEKDER